MARVLWERLWRIFDLAVEDTHLAALTLGLDEEAKALFPQVFGAVEDEPLSLAILDATDLVFVKVDLHYHSPCLFA